MAWSWLGLKVVWPWPCCPGMYVSNLDINYPELSHTHTALSQRDKWPNGTAIQQNHALVWKLNDIPRRWSGARNGRCSLWPAKNTVTLLAMDWYGIGNQTLAPMVCIALQQNRMVKETAFDSLTKLIHLRLQLHLICKSGEIPTTCKTCPPKRLFDYNWPHCDFDVWPLTSKSNHFIFVPNCI